MAIFYSKLSGEVDADQIVSIIRAVQEDGSKLLSEYDRNDPACSCLLNELLYSRGIADRLAQSRTLSADHIPSDVDRNILASLVRLLIFTYLLK